MQNADNDGISTRRAPRHVPVVYIEPEARAVNQLGIPAKANADSEGNANGIPGGRRTVVGA